MKIRRVILAQTTPSGGPKWVPIQEKWTWIAGTATVAALAAGLFFWGSRKK